MSIIEIISGTILLVTCISIIIVCLAQDQKSQDSISEALTCANFNSFYENNKNRTCEAIIAKITKFLGITFFIATIAVNLVPIFINK